MGYLVDMVEKVQGHKPKERFVIYAPNNGPD